MLIEVKNYEGIEEELALDLFTIGAVKVGRFTLTSGKESSIYLDIRKVYAHPEVRKKVVGATVSFLKEKIIEGKEYVVAGGETAGIPFASFVAYELDLRLVYVRKERKGYGRRKVVECMDDLRGYEVILLEDLITGGETKERFIEAIRKVGGEVNTCVVIFDRQEGGEELLRELGVSLYSLTNMDVLLRIGLMEGYLSREIVERIKGERNGKVN